MFYINKLNVLQKPDNFIRFKIIFKKRTKLQENKMLVRKWQVAEPYHLLKKFLKNLETHRANISTNCPSPSPQLTDYSIGVF